MARSLWIAGGVFILLLAYVLWPVVGFYRLASAIEARDSAALAKLVDFPALSKSLTKQFVHAYLEIVGKKREKQQKPKLTLIERSAAIGIGTSIAEPIVAELVNERTLLNLLTKGRLGMTDRGGGGSVEEARSAAAPFTKHTARDVWQIWLSSDYRGSDVFVHLPPGKPRDEQFRAKLSLADLEWKLSGLEFPEPLLAKSVKDIIAEQKKKSE